MNRFVLRLPEELYQRVAEQAARQGVSMNQYLMYSITQAVTAQDARAFFAEKSRGADLEKMRELLERVPDRPPISKNDRMPSTKAPHARRPAGRARTKTRSSPRSRR